MVLDLRRRGAKSGAGRRLHDKAVAKSRAPSLYSEMGAPDTVEGRFELLTLHVVLLLDRLGRESAAAEASRQALFDTYLGDLDGALREMGVGDLSVGKRMKALGAAFYGRASAYSAAFDALPDRTQLEDLIRRTVLSGGLAVDACPLTKYVISARAALARVPLEGLLSGVEPW